MHFSFYCIILFTAQDNPFLIKFYRKYTSSYCFLREIRVCSPYMDRSGYLEGSIFAYFHRNKNSWKIIDACNIFEYQSLPVVINLSNSSRKMNIFLNGKINV